ncbi:hypothetical protein HEP86_35590 [Streptomyces sp. RPA4-5]|uniref:DUF6214 family protein n=1 Tax=Streptomyces sp. RPA4-5 TaxID=2721245 RepID=UPI00143E8A2E|nr:DUF6214 family protein [Streptomyces sp. RPA4-5]QIY53185.1 hypothetical protein HEP86_35590 [Streptomyces sp. RPA4-5]
MEWPTWELQAHGSAAPAPDPAAPDDPAGSAGPGCPLPRLDPLGPWCSARLTFADGARVDVLVTVSDDHITVEDVRADPPLTLDGLADLARWIDGPSTTPSGRPPGSHGRPAPHHDRPARRTPHRNGTGDRNGAEGRRAGPRAEPGCGAVADPLRASRPAAPQGADAACSADGRFGAGGRAGIGTDGGRGGGGGWGGSGGRIGGWGGGVRDAYDG